MTREEAIKEISEILFELGFEEGQESDKRADALNMAIKALSAEPCEDCISREAVIEVLTRNGVHFCDMVKITSELKELPPVTLKPKTSPWNHGKPDVLNEYIITVRERWGKDEEWEYETLGAYYTQDGWEPSYDIDEGQEWEVIAWMPLPEPYRAESEE